MTRLKRYFFQVLLWFGIWVTLWLIEGAKEHFVVINGMAFIFQTILLAGLIFFTAPKLLFNKKYIYFILVSIASIILFAWLSFQISLFNELPPPHGSTTKILTNMPPPKGGPSPFFIHSILLALSYVLATLLETFWFAQRKEEETVKNKNEALQTELKLLKSQINPHFLFNSLNNIYALSVIDSDKTQQSISSLSDMLRYVLYECEQEQVPLSKEITYIENYIKLYALKSSAPYPITTRFDIENTSVQVAPMLFIPFMENALKHSNIEKREGAFIRIRIHADSKAILFKIENSIPKVAIVKDDIGGIGIENVRRRLAILYPLKHELNIEDNGVSFHVRLKLEINGKT